MGEQWTSIWTNQTQIDRIKNVKHETAAGFNEVLGSPLDIDWDWRWLVPEPVRFPQYPDLRYQAIFGYFRECHVGEVGDETQLLMPMGIAESVGTGADAGAEGATNPLVLSDDVTSGGIRDEGGTACDGEVVMAVTTGRDPKGRVEQIRKRNGQP